MGVKYEKVALLFGALAFQLYILTFMVSSGYRAIFSSFYDRSRDDAIQAFLIIGYLASLAAFILLLLQNYSEFKGKIVTIVTIVLLLVAALFVIIGVGIFGDYHNNGRRHPYTMTSFVTSALAGIVSAVFLLLPMFGII